MSQAEKAIVKLLLNQAREARGHARMALLKAINRIEAGEHFNGVNR